MEVGHRGGVLQFLKGPTAHLLLKETRHASSKGHGLEWLARQRGGRRYRCPSVSQSDCSIVAGSGRGGKGSVASSPQTVQALSPPQLCRRLSHISQSQLIGTIEEEVMDTSAEDDTHSGKLQTNANLEFEVWTFCCKLFKSFQNLYRDI